MGTLIGIGNIVAYAGGGGDSLVDVLDPLDFQSAQWIVVAGASATGAKSFTTSSSGTGIYTNVSTPIIESGKSYSVTVTGLSALIEVRTREITSGAGTVILSADGTAIYNATGASPNIYLRATDAGSHSVVTLTAFT